MTQSQNLARDGHGSSTPPHGTFEAEADSCAVRCLDLNDALFEAGERKTEVYQVTSGVICLFRERYGLPPRIVELVYPGGMIGLGFLDTHVLTARAVVPSTVRIASGDEIARETGQQAFAIRQEFVARRDAIVAGIPADPLLRLARFLAAVSGLNAREGRDPARISDELASGLVAEWLRMDIECLSAQLLELKRRGMAEASEDGGLLLTNLPALEALAASA